MDPKTFRDRVRVSYLGTVPSGAPDTPPTATVRYIEGNRALEIKLSGPLDRYRQVKIELLEGIMLKAGATNLKLDVAEVSGHGPLAYESGSYELDYQPGGGSATHDRGKYLFVLRKLGNIWRYEYTVWNSDLPAARD